MNNFKKILLVDDDKNDIELAIDTLKQLKIGNNIDIVEDGQEAIDYLFHKGKYATTTYDDPVLILLDIKMPKLSGLEVLSILEHENYLNTAAVIMLTSSKEEWDLMESCLYGVNTYVRKPLEPTTFLKTIKQLGILWINVNNRTILLKKLKQAQ